jgi:bifunctional DNA-binding transcriptional regulator/antitoxin component of YhaV-PrlF toxin-antitoxin module
METIVETTRMSTKGQLVIPIKTREYTESQSETLFTVSPLDKNTIVLKKMDTKQLVAEFRRLRARVKNKMTNEEINDVIRKVRQKA